MTEGISKNNMGRFFGENIQKNNDIFYKFCSFLDFKDLEIDESIRLLLSRFKLPGESQQIERIVDMFAKIYYEDNQSVFTNYEVGFILSYSIIQLHTDAHSDKIRPKEKMTKQQFIKLNQ